MCMQNRSLCLRNDITEISRIATFIEEVGEELDLPLSLVMSLNLVLEEAVANIILYAYPAKMNDEITIHVAKKEQMLVFTITDSGIAFDPTQAEEADITLSIEERPIGGLGIYLIKKIMNEVEYQRIEGNNVFTLKKVLN